MSVIIGIDPGVSGGVGVVSNSGHYIEALDIPTVSANKSSGRRMVNAYDLAAQLRRILADCAHGDVVAVTENVSAMPKQGVSSVFAFGKSYGIILGTLATLGISTELISPAKWKKH